MSESEASRTVVENVETIARLERATEQARSRGERVAEAVAAIAGTMGFVIVHVGAVAAWVAVNEGGAPGITPFDPWPFPLLNLCVAIEAVLLSAFVLINQNRLSVLSERRAHLALQVNLLTENEVTRVLRLIRRVAERMDIHDDDHERVVELSEPMAVEELVGELDRKLPAEERR